MTIPRVLFAQLPEKQKTRLHQEAGSVYAQSRAARRRRTTSAPTLIVSSAP